MSERSDWPIIVGRFRCGAEVRPGDVLGPVQINWVFGRPDRFGLTFRYLDGSGGRLIDGRPRVQPR